VKRQSERNSAKNTEAGVGGSVLFLFGFVVRAKALIGPTTQQPASVVRSGKALMRIGDLIFFSTLPTYKHMHFGGREVDVTQSTSCESVQVV
jgi:hypothetical protein